MNQTTVTTQDTLNAILNRLEKLSREVKSIKQKLTQAGPPYGTKAWWEWSDNKALEDVKKGNYTTIKSQKELDIYFKSLDSSR